MHLKNFSLLETEEGSQKYFLSPAYDLLPVNLILPEDKEQFALAVFSAAASVGRSVRILDRLNQPADHSVNIYHPEGEYLKGLLLYVE